MSFSTLLLHRIKWASSSAADVDDYGNPSAELVEPKGASVPAFVGVDGKTEVLVADSDLVRADYSIWVDADNGPPDESAIAFWEGHRLEVIAVRPVQGPGYTHHVRVLCKELR